MASVSLEIPTAEVFTPLLAPARYKGAHGGRGSGKSHFFADLAVDRGMTPGTRGVCLREIQRSLADSAKRLIEDKIKKHGAPGFRILNDRIETPGDGVILFHGMRDFSTGRSSAADIMSLEAMDWAWVEQAETLQETSLRILRPTIRKAGSELWFSWNPRRKADPVDALLRGPNRPTDSAVVRANYSENPWFPAELEAERQYDQKHSPAYRHVWEGDYATVVEGAYFATYLEAARQEGRITQLSYDPLAERRAYFDLGIDDAMTIWVAQFVSQRINFMDYIEGSGQGLEYYVNELRDRGHEKALCILPHDGSHRSAITGARFKDHLEAAGFRTRVVPNQGRGAASIRIAAMRRQFHRMWFNDGPTQAGREALGAYHEGRDEQRQIGLGPVHDWSSHGSDSAGLAACDYEPPKVTNAPSADSGVYTIGSDQSWMA